MGSLVLTGAAFTVLSGLHLGAGFYLGNKNNNQSKVQRIAQQLEQRIVQQLEERIAQQLERLLDDYVTRLNATAGPVEISHAIEDTLPQILDAHEQSVDPDAVDDRTACVEQAANLTDSTPGEPLNAPIDELLNAAIDEPLNAPDGVTVEPLKTPEDRRRSPRYPFRVVQPIAPYDSGCLPEKDEYRQVEFWDLSGEGVSFILPQPPTFEYLVAALGGRDDAWHLTARVIRVTPFTERGRYEYLVGCEFLGKMQV